jgi:poly-gamma-glutamate capsule biosynthesis protein CapA/YwtB (metallophosphatase superfamily)
MAPRKVLLAAAASMVVAAACAMGSCMAHKSQETPSIPSGDTAASNPDTLPPGEEPGIDVEREHARISNPDTLPLGEEAGADTAGVDLTSPRAYGDTDEFRSFVSSHHAGETRTQTSQGVTFSLSDGELSFAWGEEVFWRSDPYWYVDSFRLADIDGDGGTDCLFSLWKSYSYTRGQDFMPDSPEVRNHLFLYTVRGGRAKSLWCSSNLPRHIVSFELSEGIKTPISTGAVLTTTERPYGGDAQVSPHRYVWQGWGFAETDESQSFAGNPAASAQQETASVTATGLTVATADLLFAGDVLLHDYFCKAFATPGGYDFSPVFGHIAPYIQAADLAVCNLEAPVDAYGGDVKLSSFPRFNAPFEILPALKAAGFDVLLTANNHAFDQGFDGMAKTIGNITAAGLGYVGTYRTEAERKTPFVREINGIRIGIVAYTQWDNGLRDRDFAMPMFAMDQAGFDAIKQDIDACKDAGADVVVLTLHWGEEYAGEPTKAQRDFAGKLMTETDGDILVGAHPHTIQTVEIDNAGYTPESSPAPQSQAGSPVEYINAAGAPKSSPASQAQSCTPIEYINAAGTLKPVIYSLGNFCADQSLPEHPETRYGLLACVHIEKTDGKTGIQAETITTECKKTIEGYQVSYSIEPVIK